MQADGLPKYLHFGPQYLFLTIAGAIAYGRGIKRLVGGYVRD